MPRETPSEFEADLQLVEAARRGETDAARELARRLRCIPRILTALNRRSHAPLSHHDLEDLAGQVTLTVLRKLGEFRPINVLEAWVYRICALQMLNAWRRRGAQVARRTRLTPQIADAPHPFSDPLRSAAIEKALSQLDSECEAVVRLKHFEGLSFPEIGSRLSISPNTAKGRYYRALDRLRHLLASLCPEVQS